MMSLVSDLQAIASRTQVLGAGETNVLCPVVVGPGGRPRGEFLFRGRELSIETDGTDDVLFPTDVGLALLTALDGAADVALSGARVLDVGCGSGLYTVALLEAGAASVTALDLNPRAVSATEANVRRNGLDAARLDEVCANLSALGVREPWDVVVCNPPHFPQDPAYADSDGTGMALVGGPTGRSMYDLLLGRLDELLAPDGVLILAHSSLANIPKTLAWLSDRFVVRTLGVCQLDIPLRRYAAQRAVLLSRLYRLRAEKQAMFTGLRFEVHTLAVTRIAGSPRDEGGSHD